MATAAPVLETAARLSATDIAQYRREGYVVVERLFDAEELARVRETIDAMTAAALRSPDPSQVLELEPEPIDGRRVARRIYEPFHAHEQFRAFATGAKVLDRIEQLIGPDIMIHHSKLNMKPPRVGSVVEWHQDLAYFPHTNSDLVTTLVYLDDATEENGCLQVLPREHHRFFDHADREGNFAGMITEDFLSRSNSRPVPLAAPAGSVIFMHCVLPHASLPNRSAQPRRTMIFEYRAADALPIWFGPRTAHFEANVRQLRGKPARFARVSNDPAPLIPQVKQDYKSLYEAQAAAKAQRAAR
ncbi:MAG: phytanoyl-CoA dioxygenase family protein [Planctomycetota bacterium]